jgi:hypothetical protein
MDATTSQKRKRTEKGFSLTCLAESVKSLALRDAHSMYIRLKNQLLELFFGRNTS